MYGRLAQVTLMVDGEKMTITKFIVGGTPDKPDEWFEWQLLKMLQRGVAAKIGAYNEND
jgi:hypothetical protein